MIGINFDKARAEHFLDALAHGKPIVPGSPAGWTQFDMLMLAGACYFGAMSQGPPIRRIRGEPSSKEHQEADSDTFLSDLFGAIGFYSQLTRAVKDGEFDAEYEPLVTGRLRCNISGFDAKVTPGKGFKDKGDK